MLLSGPSRWKRRDGQFRQTSTLGSWLKASTGRLRPYRSLEYLGYWQQNIGNTAQVEREEWNAYWDELLKAKIAQPADREQFDHDFTNTDRQFASPRPGLQCMFAWHLDEAERLDVREQLAKAVKERINQLLEAVVKIKSIRNKAANGCCIAAASTSESDHQHHFTGTLIAERPL